jgi:hypothetical protein
MRSNSKSTWQLTCSSTGHDGHHSISPDQSPDGGLNARHLPYLMRALVAVLLFVGSACAQERPALNEFTTWFGGQFVNEHAF